MIGRLEEMTRQGRKIMAERRMVSKAVLHSPSFLAMPVAAQMLYVHLELFADDDGFVATPLQVARMMGIPKRFYQILVDQAFVIHFDSGVCVIRHWLQHNKVSPSRYNPTVYETEKARLRTEGRTYCLCQHDADMMLTQDRVGKDRLGQDRLEQDSAGKLPLSQRRFVF